MRIIVQKFGGTSLASQEKRDQACQRVMEARNIGLTPVVVVSAMGRGGDPYATDTFIQLAREVYAETAPRELDLLISCGEIISAVIMANTFCRQGLDATVLSGGQAGIITDSNFTDARILKVDPEKVLRYLEDDKVVIVAGFQGLSETGDVTTLGRGGSDTTAAALAVGLGADLLEIYTDVEGVKTADPQIVPEARTLTAVTYEEIVQMAREGAKVVHPRAVEMAMRGNVPMRVRGTFGPGTGTLVTHGGGSRWPDAREGSPVMGVTQMADVSQLIVSTMAGGVTGESDLKLFRSLAAAGISVDLINVFPERKSFIVKGESGARAKKLLEAEGFEVALNGNCAKVSVVGVGMHGLPGVMAAVVEALSAAGVEILATADSHVTISCLVRRAEMEQAIRALHERFGLDDRGRQGEKEGEHR